MSEYDAVDLGPFCAFKDYRRRGKRRPGQWTWRARYRRSQRLYRAWMASLRRGFVQAETAAFRGPRGPLNRFRHKEPRP